MHDAIGYLAEKVTDSSWCTVDVDDEHFISGNFLLSQGRGAEVVTLLKHELESGSLLKSARSSSRVVACSASNRLSFGNGILFLWCQQNGQESAPRQLRFPLGRVKHAALSNTQLVCVNEHNQVYVCDLDFAVPETSGDLTKSLDPKWARLALPSYVTGIDSICAGAEHFLLLAQVNDPNTALAFVKDCTSLPKSTAKSAGNSPLPDKREQLQDVPLLGPCPPIEDLTDDHDNFQLGKLTISSGNVSCCVSPAVTRNTVDISNNIASSSSGVELCKFRFVSHDSSNSTPSSSSDDFTFIDIDSKSRSCNFFKPTRALSFGGNAFGQLGRRTESDYCSNILPIHLHDGEIVVGISAGYDHSAVLTAGGELGVNSAALSVRCGRGLTLVQMVNELAGPGLYYWGISHGGLVGNGDEAALEPTTVTRLGVEKANSLPSILASSPQSYSYLLTTHHLPGIPLKLACRAVFVELEYVKRVGRILGFLDQLVLHAQPSLLLTEVKLLIEYLSACFTVFSDHIAVAGELRQWCQKPTPGTQPLRLICERLLTDSHLDRLVHAVKCCDTVIVAKLFKDADVPGDPDRWFAEFTSICSSNDIEASKWHRALRKMMRLPLVAYYRSIGEVMREWIGDGLNGNSQATKDLEQYLTICKNVDRFAQQHAKLAEGTYKFWASQGLLMAEYWKESRLVWTCQERAAQPVTAMADGRAVSTLTHVLLFNDALVLATKSAAYAMTFELTKLWLILPNTLDLNAHTLKQPPTLSRPAGEEDRCLILRHPEGEIVLEFAEMQWKNTFASTFAKAVSEAMRTSFSADPATQTHQFRALAHSYTQRHPLYKGCRYKGGFRDGRMTGRGTLRYPSGDEYRGLFEGGVPHGKGTLKEATANGLINEWTGEWVEGRREGLFAVRYANGDQYRGYLKDGQRHGHGVFRAARGQPPQMYIGQWQCDARAGYGVEEMGNWKYLGFWSDNKRHGRGIVITLDGYFYEGEFVHGKFVEGLMCHPDGTRLSGVFDGLGNAYGRGKLVMPNGDVIAGMLYGSGLDEGMKISGATYSKRSLSDSPSLNHAHSWQMPDWIDFGVSSPSDMSTLLPSSINASPPQRPKLSPDARWQDMLDTFHEKFLGLDQSGDGSFGTTLQLWEQLAKVTDRFVRHHSPQEHLPDELTKIMPFDAPFCAQYFRMVKRFWELASRTTHPVGHLFGGLCDVFDASYSKASAHPLLLPHAVAEILSLARRLYAILRLFFPNLPSELEANTHPAIPDDRDALIRSGSFSVSTMTHFSEVGGQNGPQLKGQCGPLLNSGSQLSDSVRVSESFNLTNGSSSGDLSFTVPEPRHESSRSFSISATPSNTKMRGISESEWHMEGDAVSLTGESQDQALLTQGSETDAVSLTNAVLKGAHLVQDSQNCSVSLTNSKNHSRPPEDYRGPPAESAMQFIVDAFVTKTYPNVFTLFVMHNAEYDRTYWRHLVIYNSKSDDELMADLQMPKKFLHVADGERCETQLKWLSSASHCLQDLANTFSLRDKLAVISRTFHIIQHLGPHQLRGSDDLTPLMSFVGIRARIKNLGAELHFILTFVPYLRQLQEHWFMVTVLLAFYVEILKPPRI